MKRKIEIASMIFWLILWFSAMWSAGKYWFIAYIVGSALMFWYFLATAGDDPEMTEDDYEEQQKLHDCI